LVNPLLTQRSARTFGFKDRYSDQEIEAVCKELDEAEQLGAIPPSTGSGD
jgi:hypothetical protein